MRRPAFVSVILLSAAPALAGGYAVSELDAAATGRGGTGVGALGGAAGVQYNPATLSRMFAIDAVAGATGIVPLASAEDPGGAARDGTVFGVKAPFHAYAAYGNGRFGVGLGVNTPFGGGLRWADDFRGRFEILEQDLQVYAGHLGGAWQLLPQLSVGAALIVYRAQITVERRLDFVDSEGTARLGGGGTGVGAQLGVSFAPDEHVRLGLTGRPPTSIGLSGRAHFSDVPDAFSSVMQDQEIQTTLPLPGRIAVGSAFHLDAVRLFADVEYMLWSAFDRFAVDFAREETPDVDQPRNWRNAFAVRLGVEMDLSDVTTLRGGLLFDQKASPADTLSPSLPDSDRLGFSLGAGRDFGFFAADAAYMFVLFVPRSSEGAAFPARYKASAHLLGLTFRLATPPGVASRSADVSTNAPLTRPGP